LSSPKLCRTQAQVQQGKYQPKPRKQRSMKTKEKKAEKLIARGIAIIERRVFIIRFLLVIKIVE
jgi:hypothetical protein